MVKRKIYIGVLSCLAFVCLVCSAIFGVLPSLRAAAEEELPVQVTYLGETEYTVSDGGASSRGAVDSNALDKGKIVLGPAVAQRRFDRGVSLLTISNAQAATLTIPVSENSGFDLFTTDFGVDAANGDAAASARFQFYADGTLLEEKTAKGSDFHGKFEISLADVAEIKISVFGKEGTCVSFGDAAFYKSSPNAVSMRVENAVYGAWPVPVQRNANLYGGGLKIGNTEYKYGFCVNSVSSFDLVVDGNYDWFSAYVGIDEAVAGGSSAGSVRIEARAVDREGKVLRSVRTPVLYGYMGQYKLLLNTSGATRIRFFIEDGGDGIGDDMAVIGAPAFSMTLGKAAAHLGDFPLLSSSVGEGTLGIDKTASGGALDYTRGKESLSFEKGVGFSLKNASYEKYLANPDNSENYAYADFDISSSNAQFFEGLFVMRSGAGAYAEVYADGELVAKAVEIVPLDKGGAPLRVSSLLPENAANLEVRLIAKAENAGGEVEFVNARLYGDGATFGGFAVSESLNEKYPYPFGRDVTPLGKEARILSKNGAKGVASSISLFAGSSVAFGVSDKEADTFSAVIGLQEGYRGALTFKVTAVFADGSRSVYTSPEISAENSYLEIAWYAGKNMEKIILEVKGDEGCVGVFGENLLFRSGYGDKERISELEWSGAESGWGTVNIDKDVMGYPINVNGTIYEKGVSMHAFNEADKYAYVQVNIPEGLGYTVFAARIGVSKDTSNGGTAGSVKFYVEGDGKILFASNLVRVSDDAQFILVDISGVSRLKLMVDNGDGGYECDFAVWIDPVIAKTTSVLDDYLRLDSPIANQSVAATGNNVFTVSGTLLGAETEAEIFLNGVSAGKAAAGKYGKFSREISVASAGRDVIEVKAGDLREEMSIFVADNAVSEKSYTLASSSTSVTVRPASNGVIIENISRADGYRWLKDSSFVRFPDEVRLGGKGGTPFPLVWDFEGAEYEEEDIVSKNIDVFKQDYVGKTKSYAFSYADESGKFSLKSVWSTQSDFAAPVSHRIDLVNRSGEKIYVSTADTLTMSLTKPQGSNLTASYSYKGAVYQTSYGYRCDRISDGYDMDVFSSTDYNNGYQEDAGFMPWVSLNADGGEGLNIGVVWSDCRAHVYGTGSDGVYIEAGLRPRFETEIPAGETFYIPESFVDAYAGGVDDGSNQLKSWLFAFNMPEVNRLDDSLPSFEFNLWELLDEERRSWRMSDSKFYTGVHQLAEMGIDEITIDTYWWKDIGDWRGVHEKWQSSITYSSDFVNALGMNFSLYMQAGNGSSLHTDAMTGIGINGNPNWFATGENKIWDELCIADSDARAFLSEYLKSYFMELGLDGIRTDFGYILGYCGKEGHDHIDNRADVGYWTSLYVYQLFEEMYKLFPAPSDVNGDSEAHYFKWENCNCGGTLKDFASMKYATRIQTTDAYDPINVRRSFYDASYALPSMQLMLWMNDYMYNGDGPYPNDNYRFWSMLMGAPCPMISMPSDMAPETYASLVNTVSIYQNWMRELVKYGDLYHILPRADGVHWDGVQYFNPDTGKGAALAFKPDPDGTVDDTVTLKFDGISDAATYYVWSEEGYIPFATYTGAQLKKGIDLTIEESYGAEIVYFMDTTAAGAEETVARPKAFSVETLAGIGRLELTLGLSENADYYVFALEKEGETVYAFIADEFGAKSNLLEGLFAGSYKLTVTAYNRFGSTTREYEAEVEGSSEFADAGYVVSGADGGEIVIDGARYIDGHSLDLSDKEFGEAAFRTIDVTNLGGRTALNIRAALAVGDEAERAEISIYGVKGGKKELLKSLTVSAKEKFYDVSVNIEGYSGLKITAENTSPDVYTQTAVGYGRTGLYGGAASENYDFSFDVRVLRNGLNETFPRAGGFAAYVDDDNFAALYLDAYYSNIVIYERVGGQRNDKTYKIKMEEDFDYSAKHTLRAVRSGENVFYFVDGELVAEHTLKLAPSKVALITEDAQARFSDVVRRIGGRVEEISWRAYNVGVNIYGKNVYSTKVTQGVWARVKPRLQLVLY